MIRVGRQESITGSRTCVQEWYCLVGQSSLLLFSEFLKPRATVAFLCWRVLMPDSAVLIQHVSFSYEGSTEPLIVDLTAHFARGWTGVVGANGVGKSTILKLAAGILQPKEGQVAATASAIYCEQRTDSVPPLFDDFLGTKDGAAASIKDQLGVQNDWRGRWDSLSHGERKRAQIAVALWQEPELLALDEPTNHLDGKAREFLFGALLRYQGVGLLVSHDRTFLDELCFQCLFVDPPDSILRPGNYSQGVLQAEQERATALRLRSEARHELERLNREANKRRSAAADADRRRSKRGLARGDHDTRAKINLARVTGKDGGAGKRLRQMEGRLAQARTRADRIKVRKVYALGIWMPGARSQRNTLFNIPAGMLSLGEDRCLEFPDLLMKPDDRVALVGSNGSGKSTLIARIRQSLNVEAEQVTFIPQEIDLRASHQIMARARSLPGAKLGHMMTIVSRLGSTPQRLLETEEPSPGEVRKVLLATGIANEPHIIIMDEPTNHLDLPSIQCLEEALADCPCGLLLVSHDIRFLDALTRQSWHISEDVPNSGKYRLKTD
jgi:macrolide transport system ATP-binding/permease protein